MTMRLTKILWKSFHPKSRAGRRISVTSLFSLGFLLIPTVERILAGLPDKLWCEETMIPICLIALASIMLLVWDVARRRFRRWWKWDI